MLMTPFDQPLLNHLIFHHILLKFLLDFLLALPSLINHLFFDLLHQYLVAHSSYLQNLNQNVQEQPQLVVAEYYNHL